MTEPPDGVDRPAGRTHRVPRRVLQLAVAAVVATVAVVAGYAVYSVSAYGEHDRRAAQFARDARADLLAVGDVRVLSGEHDVGASHWDGGFCILSATFQVATSLDKGTLERRLKAMRERPYGLPSWEVTQLGARQGRERFEVETSTSVEGGVIDLRCG